MSPPTSRQPRLARRYRRRQVILGEDYGEGASVVQERSYAYALKSSIWLLDPRPDLPSIVRTVEKGFELSEASHAPVMLELRIRACHATGAFCGKEPSQGVVSGLDKLPGPPRFEYGRLAHPPVIFTQERLKVEERLPAARAFIREHRLNETITGDLNDVGIIVMGGLTNSVLRALERMELADVFGASHIPVLVLNVVYPLVPEELQEFCAGKSAVLVVEEGYPDYIEQAVNVELRRADINAQSARQRAVAECRRMRLRCVARRTCRVSAGYKAERHRCRHDREDRARPDRSQAGRRGRARRFAPPARLLYRLSGAASILRHQVDAARA